VAEETNQTYPLDSWLLGSLRETLDQVTALGEAVVAMLSDRGSISKLVALCGDTQVKTWLYR